MTRKAIKAIDKARVARAMSRIDRIDGPESYRQALGKARCGRSDWLWWWDGAGPHAARKSPATIKAMLLAVGTKGRWTLICAGGMTMKGFWRLGIKILAQARRGW